MKFKRTNGAQVEVNWNPQKGKACPFNNYVDEMNIPILHRKKNVVVMNEQCYQVVKSWHDFHPTLENGAILAPLEVVNS